MKNNAIRSKNELDIERGLKLFILFNDFNKQEYIKYEVDKTFIQFHFAFKGNSVLYFNNNYQVDLKSSTTILLYNPTEKLPVNIGLEPYSTVLQIMVSIKTFHQLFSDDIGFIDFLDKENIDKKYYKQSEITPAVNLVINQILNEYKKQSVKKLYIKGKVFELLSLYFGYYEKLDTEQCPFLAHKSNVLKIRRAKEIIIERMSNPPTLENLSKEIELNLKQLKMGFKQIYGQSVFAFLLDYKMEYARSLLEEGTPSVNDVSAKIGYSTTSHFISAFKKKYGITPKQFVLRMG